MLPKFQELEELRRKIIGLMKSGETRNAIAELMSITCPKELALATAMVMLDLIEAMESSEESKYKVYEFLGALTGNSIVIQ